MLPDAPGGECRGTQARNPPFPTPAHHPEGAAGLGTVPPGPLDFSMVLSLESSVPPSETMGHVKEIRRGTLQEQTFYEQVGGEETFRRLVRRFYEGVAEDPILRPMYPEEDLGPAEERLVLFLIQYWGGPTTYSENRGHPRLRMRHAPFTVDRAAHDAWLKHMRDAVDDLNLTEEHAHTLWNYLTYAAASMVNTPD